MQNLQWKNKPNNLIAYFAVAISVAVAVLVLPSKEEIEDSNQNLNQIDIPRSSKKFYFN